MDRPSLDFILLLRSTHLLFLFTIIYLLIERWTQWKKWEPYVSRWDQRFKSVILLLFIEKEVIGYLLVSLSLLFVRIYLIKYVVLCSFPLNKTKLILLAINCNFIYGPNEIIFCHFVMIYSKSSSTSLFHKALLINLHQSNMTFKK